MKNMFYATMEEIEEEIRENLEVIAPTSTKERAEEWRVKEKERLDNTLSLGGDEEKIRVVHHLLTREIASLRELHKDRSQEDKARDFLLGRAEEKEKFLKRVEETLKELERRKLVFK